MNGNKLRVVLMDEAKDFLMSLPLKARQKVHYNLQKVEKGILDKELFKKLDDTDIWELRTLFNGIKYRFFAFWDTQEETLVVATHGIIKRTQKTSEKEIAKAEAMKNEYFNSKNR